jgi:hypothetical protein
MIKGQHTPTNFLFWQRWLIVAMLSFMVFSLGMVIAPQLTRQFFSLLMYATPSQLDTFGSAAVAYISLLHAVLGAVMFGWGLIMLLIVLGPLGRRSWDAWRMLALSIAAWFIPDTTYSLWSGFWQNAAFNLVFVVLFAVPLIATYSTCRNHRS